MPFSYHFISKLIVLGDSGTGKSSLTIRLCENRFVQQHDVTIGVEFGSQIVPVGPPASYERKKGNSSNRLGGFRQLSDMQIESQQKFMKLSLWDTAGQETYKSITRSYFRGASGALLVFDISRRSTFDSVTGWLQDLRRIADENIVVVLVGNKSDLAATTHTEEEIYKKQGIDKRQVSEPEALAWCHANNILTYVETSAKRGDGVEEAFLEVADRIFENVEAGKYDLNDRRSGVKGASINGKKGANQDLVTLERPDPLAGRTAGRSFQCC